MPTYEWLSYFDRDWKKLTLEQQQAFRAAATAFVEDLREGQGFRKGLRVKKMSGHEGIWELTWAPDGRATFHYGQPVVDGEKHVVWRRIGTHAIFERP